MMRSPQATIPHVRMWSSMSHQKVLLIWPMVIVIATSKHYLISAVQLSELHPRCKMPHLYAAAA